MLFKSVRNFWLGNSISHTLRTLIELPNVCVSRWNEGGRVVGEEEKAQRGVGTEEGGTTDWQPTTMAAFLRVCVCCFSCYFSPFLRFSSCCFVVIVKNKTTITTTRRSSNNNRNSHCQLAVWGGGSSTGNCGPARGCCRCLSSMSDSTIDRRHVCVSVCVSVSIYVCMFMYLGNA